MILVNGWQTPVSRIPKFPRPRRAPPEPISDSTGLEKPMIPMRVLLQTWFEEPAARMKKTLAARGCPFGAAPLHQRQQISINPLAFRDRDGASVRPFHAGLVQDLSRQPQGTR